jgi:hypothetical protein
MWAPRGYSERNVVRMVLHYEDMGKKRGKEKWFARIPL